MGWQSNEYLCSLAGRVWDLILDPTIGHEQAGSRPALIVSVDIFNEGPADLVVVIPVTRTERKVRWHVPVKPPEGEGPVRAAQCLPDIRSLGFGGMQHLCLRVYTDVLHADRV